MIVPGERCGRLVAERWEVYASPALEGQHEAIGFKLVVRDTVTGLTHSQAIPLVAERVRAGLSAPVAFAETILRSWASDHAHFLETGHRVADCTARCSWVLWDTDKPTHTAAGEPLAR